MVRNLIARQDQLKNIFKGTQNPKTEAKIKEETQATIRCIPFGVEQTPGTDMVSGKPSTKRVIIARSY